MKAERPEVPLEEPQAKLERALIAEYLRSRGYDLRTLHERPADEIKAVLRDAALHAAGRLAEVEARASYLHEIHGAARPPE